MIRIIRIYNRIKYFINPCKLKFGRVELNVENIASNIKITKATSAFNKAIRSPSIKKCFKTDTHITPIAQNPKTLLSQNVDKIKSIEIRTNSKSSIFFMIELFFLNGSVKFCTTIKKWLILIDFNMNL